MYSFKEFTENLFDKLEEKGLTKDLFKAKCPNCGKPLMSCELDMELDKVVYRCRNCKKEFI